MYKKNKIAILSLNYSYEYSPSIKNMAIFFAKKGIDTTIITDEAVVDLENELRSVRIVPLIRKRILELHRIKDSASFELRNFGKYFFILLNIVIQSIRKFVIQKSLEKISRSYDYIFCVEMNALDLLYRSKFPLNRAIYISLELEQFIDKNKISYARNLIGACAFCVIQNPERAVHLSKILKVNLTCEYFPVSIPPTKDSIEKNVKTRYTTFVYSGAIIDWSYLREFIEAIKKIPKNIGVRVVVLGRQLGHQGYSKQIVKMCKNDHRFRIDLSYKTDKQLLKLVRGGDIGIAFYKKPNNQYNWENLLTSSGKIAFYLWSGLAVLTNLKESGTQSPPFLYLNKIDYIGLIRMISVFRKNRGIYAEKSLSLAKQKYNSDIYLDRILGRTLSLGLLKR